MADVDAPKKSNKGKPKTKAAAAAAADAAPAVPVADAPVAAAPVETPAPAVDAGAAVEKLKKKKKAVDAAPVAEVAPVTNGVAAHEEAAHEAAGDGAGAADGAVADKKRRRTSALLGVTTPFARTAQVMRVALSDPVATAAAKALRAEKKAKKDKLTKGDASVTADDVKNISEQIKAINKANERISSGAPVPLCLIADTIALELIRLGMRRAAALEKNQTFDVDLLLQGVREDGAQLELLPLYETALTLASPDYDEYMVKAKAKAEAKAEAKGAEGADGEGEGEGEGDEDDDDAEGDDGDDDAEDGGAAAAAGGAAGRGGADPCSMFRSYVDKMINAYKKANIAAYSRCRVALGVRVYISAVLVHTIKLLAETSGTIARAASVRTVETAHIKTAVTVIMHARARDPQALIAQLDAITKKFDAIQEADSKAKEKPLTAEEAAQKAADKKAKELARAIRARDVAAQKIAAAAAVPA